MATDTINARKFNLYNSTIEYGTVVILAVLIIIFTLLKPKEFLSLKNLLILMQQVAPLGLSAIGLTFLMAMKYYDLSIGFTVSLGGVVATTLFGKGFPEGWGIIATICLIGGGVGLLNGLIVTLFRVPSLMVTIGVGFICYGIIYMITGGSAVYYGIPPHFSTYGRGIFFHIIPHSVVILAVFVSISIFIFQKTAFGRYIYAIGNNETASELSGIKVRLIKLSCFLLCSTYACLAGMLIASENMVGHTTAGERYLLHSLTAAFLGTSIFRRGEGNIWGTIVGVLILGVAYNGMTMLGTPYTLREVITGSVLIVAMAISKIRG